MKYQVCAVYDSKARAFLPPIFVSNVDVGLRAVRNAANDPQQQIGRNPEDYIFFHLGTWDDDDSLFGLFDVPKHLTVAANLIGKKGE